MKLSNVWKHYTDYLIEATHKSQAELSPKIDYIRTRIQEGCSRLELKALMLSVFTPITIMQALEQWQNQMDLLMNTGLNKFDGLSRYEHADQESPYADLVDGILDSELPSAHIYDLSSTTQDLAHMISEHGGKEAPSLLSEIMENANLKNNWELLMLLGDCYRQNGQFAEALEAYEKIKINGHYPDSSIQDAIDFTAFMQERGSSISGKPFDSILPEYQEYKTVRRTGAKIGRNDPCPCGSGKKYKFCCGRNRNV